MRLLRALTYYIKGMLYRRQKKALEMGIYQQEAKNAAEDALSEAEKNFFILEESLVNDESD